MVNDEYIDFDIYSLAIAQYSNRFADENIDNKACLHCFDTFKFKLSLVNISKS